MSLTLLLSYYLLHLHHLLLSTLFTLKHLILLPSVSSSSSSSSSSNTRMLRLWLLENELEIVSSGFLGQSLGELLV